MQMYAPPAEQDQPAVESYGATCGRMNYFLATVFLFAVPSLLHELHPVVGLFADVGALCLWIPLARCRLRDIGENSKKAWRVFIPYYNIGFCTWLQFTPANRGRDHHSTTLVIVFTAISATLIGLLSLLLIVGIVATQLGV